MAAWKTEKSTPWLPTKKNTSKRPENTRKTFRFTHQKHDHEIWKTNYHCAKGAQWKGQIFGRACVRKYWKSIENKIFGFAQRKSNFLIYARTQQRGNLRLPPAGLERAQRTHNRKEILDKKPAHTRQCALNKIWERNKQRGQHLLLNRKSTNLTRARGIKKKF